jgi:hypothetical protein
MSKDNSELVEDRVRSFIRFSLAEIDKLVDSVDLKDCEDNCIKQFSEHYHGKIPLRNLESSINQYLDYLRGYNPRKFLNNSAFVKLENSAKVVDGVVMNRPRLIMTMSDLMKMELIPILDIIHRWNEGKISEFQVKNLEPDAFLDKVMVMTGVKHLVTDYSSFESSIFGKIRQLENYCLVRLCLKAGLNHLASRVVKYMDGHRVLKTSAGTFVSDSRNSGDFQTSMGNGLINYLLAKYNHLENGSKTQFRMIAEGDDGIVEPQSVNIIRSKELGFKFSSELCGSIAGDVDFLRCRWMDGVKYLNVGRSIKMIWTLKNKTLSRRDIKTIQRCAAYSMHLSSPGHPVLGALVVRIGRETSGCNSLSRTALGFVRKQWNFDERCLSIKDFPKEFVVNESMRGPLAVGAAGFPPISIRDQLILEKALLEEPVPELASLLTNYEEFNVLMDQECFSMETIPVFSGDMVDLLSGIKVDY